MNIIYVCETFHENKYAKAQFCCAEFCLKCILSKTTVYQRFMLPAFNVHFLKYFCSHRSKFLLKTFP